MDPKLPHLIRRCLNALCHEVKQRLRRWTKPYNQSLPLNVVLDLTRSKSELVLENALLRQQLIVLQRQVNRPVLTWRDRSLLVLMARKLPIWKTALMISARMTPFGQDRGGLAEQVVFRGFLLEEDSKPEGCWPH